MPISRRWIISFISLLSITILLVGATALVIKSSEPKQDSTHFDAKIERLSSAGQSSVMPVGKIEGMVSEDSSGGNGDPDPEDLMGGVQMEKGFCDSLAPGETKIHEINAARSSQFGVTCFCKSSLKIALINPQGVRLDSASASKRSEGQYLSVEMDKNEYMITFSIGDNPSPGKWQVEVSNPAGNQSKNYYMLMVMSYDSAIKLEVKLDKEHYQKEDPVMITASLTNSMAPVLGANVAAFIWDESRDYGGRIATRADMDSLRLYDDGTHGDLTAGDGKYSYLFTKTENGGEFAISVRAITSGPEPVERSGYTVALVSQNRAHLTGQYNDYGKDNDRDGIYDCLIFEAGINIIDSASYRFAAQLQTPQYSEKTGKGHDDYMANVISQATIDTFLAPGAYVIPLQFSAEDIYKKHIDGPYKIGWLSVVANELEVIDFLEAFYVTHKYGYTGFQGKGIVFKGLYSDEGIDCDHDGLFDSLIVKLEFEISITDNYFWQGSLIDSNGNHVDLMVCRADLTRGPNYLRLPFCGKNIRENKQDGPFKINEIAISGRDKGDYKYDLFEPDNTTTKYYKYTDFE